MLKEIPVVEYNSLPTNEEEAKVVAAAFRDIGFLFVHMDGISGILAPIYDAMRKFFSLEDEVKRVYARPDLAYQRGWTPPFQELGIACRSLGANNSPLPDAKENWFIGDERIDEHPLAKQYPAFYPRNIWPKEVPELRTELLKLYSILHECGLRVLKSLTNNLLVPVDYFDKIVNDAPTAMRAIHYPQVLPEQVGKLIWACKHTDINLVTVLPASTRPGLWIRRSDGVWIPGNAPEDSLIVQVGDMLDYLTGGYFVSAAHEVRAPDKPTSEGRYSAALFMHPNSLVTLSPIVNGPDSAACPPITAGDYLMKRLKAIRLAH